MSSYSFPKGMRPATLRERRSFYRGEFELEKVAEWFRGRKDIVNFAVIIGRHTKIYPKKYAKEASTTILIDEYEDLTEVRDWIMEFLPEGVYYDRNVYEDDKVVGQELVFDLDPENIACPIHGTLEDKMKRGQGLSFCELEFQMVKEETMRLHEYLEKLFSHLKIVYSGRGFHIHIFDEEAYGLKPRGRAHVARKIRERGFHIDTWVTMGEMRLIRLPYSLNGLVSRIVLPLRKKEVEGFDPVKDRRCIPAFLRKTT